MAQYVTSWHIFIISEVIFLPFFLDSEIFIFKRHTPPITNLSTHTQLLNHVSRFISGRLYPGPRSPAFIGAWVKIYVFKKNHDKESLTLPTQGFLFKGLMVSARHQSFYFLNYLFFLTFHAATPPPQSLCIFMFEYYTKALKYVSRIFRCLRCCCESRKTMKELDDLNHVRSSNIHEADRKMMSSRPAYTR